MKPKYSSSEKSCTWYKPTSLAGTLVTRPATWSWAHSTNWSRPSTPRAGPALVSSWSKIFLWPIWRIKASEVCTGARPNRRGTAATFSKRRSNSSRLMNPSLLVSTSPKDKAKKPKNSRFSLLEPGATAALHQALKAFLSWRQPSVPHGLAAEKERTDGRATDLTGASMMREVRGIWVQD